MNSFRLLLDIDELFFLIIVYFFLDSKVGDKEKYDAVR